MKEVAQYVLCMGRIVVEHETLGMQRVNKGRGHKVLGIAYVKCVLDLEKKTFKDQGIYDFMEDFWVKNYCLFLSFIDGGEFEGNVAVMYYDWDVENINFNKCLPSLCENLFGYNIFG